MARIPEATFFAQDEYHTLDGTTRRWADRLGMNTRFYFMGVYIHSVLQARMLAGRQQFDRAALTRTSWRLLRLIEGCGGRLHISGLVHTGSLTGPAVFISNHMSSMEANIFPAFIPEMINISFVVKESLTTIPVFGKVLQAHEPIPVSRQNPRVDLQQVLVQGKEKLEAGRAVIIFPQGTRRLMFDPHDFNSLGVKLAKRAGVPVVPVALRTDFWQNGRFLRDLGPLVRDKPVYFAFGEPFLVEDSKLAHQRVVEFIQDHTLAWQMPGQGRP